MFAVKCRRHLLLDAIHDITDRGGRRSRVQLTSSGILVPLLRIMQSRFVLNLRRGMVAYRCLLEGCSPVDSFLLLISRSLFVPFSDEDSDSAGLALSALLHDLPYDRHVHTQILDSVQVSHLVDIIGEGQGLMDGEASSEVRRHVTDPTPTLICAQSTTCDRRHTLRYSAPWLTGGLQVAALLITYLGFTAADCEEIFDSGVVDPLLKVLDFAARVRSLELSGGYAHVLRCADSKHNPHANLSGAQGMYDPDCYSCISAAMGCLAQLCAHVRPALDKV